MKTGILYFDICLNFGRCLDVPVLTDFREQFERDSPGLRPVIHFSLNLPSVWFSEFFFYVGLSVFLHRPKLLNCLEWILLVEDCTPTIVKLKMRFVKKQE